MQCVDRYEQYKDEDFDAIIMMIKNGKIKSGRYAGLVKIKKNYKVGKELFGDGRDKESDNKRQ